MFTKSFSHRQLFIWTLMFFLVSKNLNCISFVILSLSDIWLTIQAFVNRNDKYHPYLSDNIVIFAVFMNLHYIFEMILPSLENESTSSIAFQTSLWFRNLSFNPIFSDLISKLMYLKNICSHTKIQTCQGHTYGYNTTIGYICDYKGCSFVDGDDFWALWLNPPTSWRYQQVFANFNTSMIAVQIFHSISVRFRHSLLNEITNVSIILQENEIP